VNQRATSREVGLFQIRYADERSATHAGDGPWNAQVSEPGARRVKDKLGVHYRVVKTLVLGAGVVGVTTAYFLAKAGHDVTILDERDGVGLEASAGNAGIIAPGHAFAWASPGAPRMLLESLRGADTAIRVRLGRDPRLYAWGLRFLRECTPDRSRRNTLVKLGLCQYSQAVMDALVRAEGIEYHAIAQGALYVHRDPSALDAGIKKMALLAEHGQRQEVLDPGALARLDPVFAPVQGKMPLAQCGCHNCTALAGFQAAGSNQPISRSLS